MGEKTEYKKSQETVPLMKPIFQISVRFFKNTGSAYHNPLVEVFLMLGFSIAKYRYPEVEKFSKYCDPEIDQFLSIVTRRLSIFNIWVTIPGY